MKHQLHARTSSRYLGFFSEQDGRRWLMEIMFYEDRKCEPGKEHKKSCCLHVASQGVAGKS